MPPRHRFAATRPKLCGALLLAAAWHGGAFAQSGNDNKAPATLQRVQALGEPGQSSFQLLFSPQGGRFARSSSGGVELWQVQPLQLLGKVAESPTPQAASQQAHDSLRFSADGTLHYVAASTHAWLTPQLQRGTGSEAKALSADARYALRSGSVGNGSIGRDGRLEKAGIPPQNPFMTDDVYDLREKRSDCQLPRSGRAEGMSVGGQWFAIQEAAAGPSNPRPLVVCDLAKGQAFLMPLDKANVLTPTIDPQGRWMAVTSSIPGSFFASSRIQTRLYALPLRPDDFSVDASRQGCEAALPCGQPKPLPAVDEPPAHAQASPDGKWLVGLLVRPNRAVFFDTASMKNAATLELPPSTGDGDAGHRRTAFSRNGRWMALQSGGRLYLVDLQAAQPALAEVRPDTAQFQFQLQDIDNDGVFWLMHQRSEAGGAWASALWRLSR